MAQKASILPISLGGLLAWFRPMVDGIRQSGGRSLRGPTRISPFRKIPFFEQHPLAAPPAPIHMASQCPAVLFLDWPNRLQDNQSTSIDQSIDRTDPCRRASAFYPFPGALGRLCFDVCIHGHHTDKASRRLSRHDETKRRTSPFSLLRMTRLLPIITTTGASRDIITPQGFVGSNKEALLSLFADKSNPPFAISHMTTRLAYSLVALSSSAASPL